MAGSFTSRRRAPESHDCSRGRHRGKPWHCARAGGHDNKVDNGVFADRDLYDLLVAAERDQEGLRRVLASITVEEKAMIASELRALPRNRSISEPIREPTYPSLVRDLARRAGRLFDVDDWRRRTRR